MTIFDKKLIKNHLKVNRYGITELKIRPDIARTDETAKTTEKSFV